MRALFLTVLIAWLLTGSAQAKPFLNITPVTTPKGIAAWLIEDHSQPIIALSFGFIGAGAVNDPAHAQGRAHLLSNMLDEGAGPYDSTAFQKMLEDQSISLGFQAGRDHFTGHLKTLVETQETAFSALHLALTQPRLEKDALARMVGANITRLQNGKTDGEWILSRLTFDRAYAGHPYAQNTGGTLTSLAQITPDDLRAHLTTFLTRTRLRVSIVGDVTPDQAGAIIDQIFADLPAGTPPAPLTPLPLQNTGDTYLFNLPTPQTQIALLGPAPAQGSADEIPFMVMNHILGGGGFGSRLTDVIREKNGLTYGISAGINHLDQIDTLHIQTSTRNDQVGRMHDLIRGEITRLKTDGIHKQDLSAAQDYLLGSMATALTSTDQIAGMVLNLQLNARPLTYFDDYQAQIRALTPRDIHRVAQKWLNPDDMLTLMVGDPKPPPKASVIKTLPNVE